MDPDLRRLLMLRHNELTADTAVDLSKVVHFLVASRGDALGTIEAAAGFPLIGEHAPVERVRRHPGGWLEAVIVTPDDGFAVVVFVRNCICSDAQLVVAFLAAAT